MAKLVNLSKGIHLSRLRFERRAKRVGKATRSWQIVGVIPGEKFIPEAIRLQNSIFLKNLKVDIFELRIDRFDKIKPDVLIPTIKNLRRKLRIPLLATIRWKEEADSLPIKHNLTEKERLNLFKNIIPYVDAIDIELQAKEIISPVINFAKGGNHLRKKTVIVSYHNFKETPENSKLNQIVRKAKEYHADIIKLALYAKNIDDVVRLMCFIYNCPDKSLAAISLGKIGNLSRIIAPFFGSCLTYGFVGNAEKNGQITIADLIQKIEIFLRRQELWL